MTYLITAEGSSTILTEVDTREQALEWIKNRVFENFDSYVSFVVDDSEEQDELNQAMEETFSEGAPWCLYIDETGLPLRYDIHRA